MNRTLRIAAIAGHVAVFAYPASAQTTHTLEAPSPAVSIPGVAVFPGAEARPAVAEAVAAYYRGGLPEGKTIDVAVYVTDAPFEEVYAFYGPRMDAGKWGWRTKTYPLEHHVRTLKFMRAGALRQGGQDLPADLAPFWGDPASPAAEFDAALDRLLAENSGTSIQVVEGTRGIAGDPAGGEVRITVEQPYVDLNRMEIVDRTRIVLVNLSERE